MDSPLPDLRKNVNLADTGIPARPACWAARWQDVVSQAIFQEVSVTPSLVPSNVN